MSEPLVVNDRVTIPGSELSWTSVRASGSGGQNVNKVSSKVELRLDLAATTTLDATTIARLRVLAGSRVDGRGVLTIESQLTRDRPRNLEDAREKLAELIRRALELQKPRRPTRPSRGAQRGRLDDKKRHGQKKRERRVREE
jgi:ribosome-associated protein